MAYATESTEDKMGSTPFDDGYRAYPHRPRMGNPYGDYLDHTGNTFLYRQACYRAWFEGWDRAAADAGLKNPEHKLPCDLELD